MCSRPGSDRARAARCHRDTAHPRAARMDCWSTHDCWRQHSPGSSRRRPAAATRDRTATSLGGARPVTDRPSPTNWRGRRAGLGRERRLVLPADRPGGRQCAGQQGRRRWSVPRRRWSRPRCARSPPPSASGPTRAAAHGQRAHVRGWLDRRWCRGAAAGSRWACSTVLRTVPSCGPASSRRRARRSR